jgi:hypothetical protein
VIETTGRHILEVYICKLGVYIEYITKVSLESDDYAELLRLAKKILDETKKTIEEEKM